MKVSIEIDPDFLVDIGMRDSEERYFAQQMVAAMLKILQRSAGHPTGSEQVIDGPAGTYEWSDANWLLTYKLSDRRTLWLTRHRTIRIVSVRILRDDR